MPPALSNRPGRYFSDLYVHPAYAGQGRVPVLELRPAAGSPANGGTIVVGR